MDFHFKFSRHFSSLTCLTFFLWFCIFCFFFTLKKNFFYLFFLLFFATTIWAYIMLLSLAQKVCCIGNCIKSFLEFQFKFWCFLRFYKFVNFLIFSFPNVKRFYFFCVSSPSLCCIFCQTYNIQLCNIIKYLPSSMNFSLNIHFPWVITNKQKNTHKI